MIETIKEQSKRELRILNDELENYFTNTIIPQLFVDADLILRKFTPPAMRHFALSDSDINRPMQEVKDNIRHPTLIDNIEEVIATNIILEKEIQTTDGRWFQMNILPYVVKKENRTNGVIITFVDITGRISSLKELERMNAERETLNYTLSHDIRQPLVVISFLVEELEEAFNKRDEDVFTKGLETLKKSFDALKTLVDDFSGAMEPEQVKGVDERVNIENIYQDVWLALRDDVYNKDISITSGFNTSEIRFSRINLRSIVYNLLYNAIKFRRPGLPLKIDISTEREGDYVILSVSDNGLGIAQKDLETVVQKQVRLHHNIEGTGMGLYLIKQMVTSRGGKIEVESTLGEGTVFKVYFQSGYEGEH